MGKIKILITGSNGLLGQKLVNLFVHHNYTVFATSKGENRNINTKEYEYINANITNFNKVTGVIKKIAPDFIIHAAAMTNVDACELRRRECKEINAKAVKNIVKACEEFKIHLIHISTDFIFKGKKGYYKEDDKENPVNYYGEMKLKSEKYLKKSNIDFTILRTIVLYGYTPNSNRNNLILWIKESLEQQKTINIVTDQYRMATYVDDLAKACLLSVRKKVKGIFHISSNELMSVYDIAIETAKAFNLDSSLIKPIPTKKLNQTAKRPKKTGFNLDKSARELGFKSVSFKERIRDFKKELDQVK